MPTCEKCWSDAYSPGGDQVKRYRELLRASVRVSCGVSLKAPT